MSSPTDPPPSLWERAEKVGKAGSALKTIGSIALGVVVGIGSAYAWAKGKADKAEVTAVSQSDAAAHKDIGNAQSAIVERIAHIEGRVDVILDQNRQILSMVRKLNELDERRGTPTRLPIQEASR
jgi:hypothetical protein